MLISNRINYYFTRSLQRLGLSDLTVQVGRTARAIIPNPPLVIKAFTQQQSRDGLLHDASLESVLKLVRTAKTFWDVGANIGLYSMLAREANPELQVVSIEASTDFYQTLCRNWQLNPDRWICLHVAVGDGEGPVHMSRGLRGLDHVLPASELKSQKLQELRPMMTLDHLARLVGQDRIDVLKIDVEGLELPVLKGAAKLLETGKIGAIVLEADQHDLRYGSSNSELVSYLASKNYELAGGSATGSAKGNCQVFQASAASAMAPGHK